MGLLELNAYNTMYNTMYKYIYNNCTTALHIRHHFIKKLLTSRYQVLQWYIFNGSSTIPGTGDCVLLYYLVRSSPISYPSSPISYILILISLGIRIFIKGLQYQFQYSYYSLIRLYISIFKLNCRLLSSVVVLSTVLVCSTRTVINSSLYNIPSIRYQILP